MKNLMILFAFFIVSNSALAFHTTGQCRLEGSQQNFKLEDVDPTNHYGMIAEGFSPKGDRVFLDINFQKSIHGTIQSKRGMGYTMVLKDASGKTPVRFGIYTKGVNGQSQNEWVSCDLVVEE